MGLDITLHRKDVVYGKDYWFNGRNRFGAIKDLMVDIYNYKQGEDLRLTVPMMQDLLTMTHKLIIASTQNPNDYYDIAIYDDLYNALLKITDDILFAAEEWYFEATW